MDVSRDKGVMADLTHRRPESFVTAVRPFRGPDEVYRRGRRDWDFRPPTPGVIPTGLAIY